MWYPENKKELEEFIENSFKQKTNLKEIPRKINGLIVPHAGYEYSGNIAGKAFSLLKNKNIEKAIVLGPSHYISLNKVVTSDKFEWQTPLGKIRLFNTGFPTNDIEKEHSINNQIPFLQKLGIKEIMPLMAGEIIPEQARQIAGKIAKIPNAIYIFSTDLSHFMHYDNAVQRDKHTMKIIENLEIENKENIDACGIYPLLILFYLCKLLNTKPHLIEYKNSGDVTNDKIHGVVGYASFWF
jgi:AmmeMemoRadiSam system protein B